ncbi:30S ribosomal protein S16 [Gloeobacter kilaueensis JS1]|uniref:Small ribosomal subunit protein bS16 n=1 Tax=Gloeobacter kilaueensis (strain ATCC BAA-2537 / CCAP 1431/1 / ULC 316 / JS1) TaxID=1183438 RepID=U5QDN8_GLOK1|nr:30S ribosomal protein S16 [Gloeobacter kilaueensis JS1]
MKRIGAKKKPVYRIVVADSRSRRDGAVIEEIGFYDPRANVDRGQTDLTVDVEAARKWLATGARPSETVAGLLKRAQVYPLTSASAGD